VVPGVLRRLGQLRDCHLRGRHVRIAEAEIDDVLAGSTQLELEAVDLRERVRRQRTDPAEPDLGRPL
jgi:hypothetical protein